MTIIILQVCLLHRSREDMVTWNGPQWPSIGQARTTRTRLCPSCSLLVMGKIHNGKNLSHQDPMMMLEFRNQNSWQFSKFSYSFSVTVVCLAEEFNCCWCRWNFVMLVDRIVELQLPAMCDEGNGRGWEALSEEMLLLQELKLKFWGRGCETLLRIYACWSAGQGLPCHFVSRYLSEII